MNESTEESPPSGPTTTFAAAPAAAPIDVNERFTLLGVPIDAVDLRSATRRILAWAGDRRGRFVCVRDVHGLMRAVDDATLMAVHRRAAMVTPDGMPIARIGRWRGHEVSQTCGSDLMESVLAAGLDGGLRHYFYGGQEGVADELADAFRRRLPELQVVGTCCPPFRALSAAELAEHVDRINASEAQVVWVGISTPKQEYWMDAAAPRLTGTAIGVGAAFDFHTGRVHRAPVWIRHMMLEWAYRVVREPKRLLGRYLSVVPRFVLLCIAESVRDRRSR